MKKVLLFQRTSIALSTLITHICMPLLLICAFTAQLNAQAPKISIQGTLKAANGASVVDGTYAVTFKLYNTETGGTALWQENAQVEVVGSIYSHYLGSITPLNAADFATTLYLGVKVGSYELIPRTELAYSPYAFSVSVAQTVLCSGGLGDVKYSILNPTQFAAANGACWVPMDGRALATTDQLRIATGMTAVPDGSGLFLRSQEFSGGANNDPDRNSGSAIGAFQGDEYRSHNHTMQTAGNHSHSLGSRGYETNGAPGADGSFDDSNIQTHSAGAHTHPIDNSGGSETRPKNLNFWIYIRIN